MDHKRLSAVIVGLVLLLGVLFLIGEFDQSRNEAETSVEGDRANYTAEINFTGTKELNIQTEYLAVDGMKNLDSEELTIESDSCLRFIGYEGSILFGNVSNLEGKASGFATCDLNATTDFQINEEVDAEKIYTTKDESHGNIELNDVDLSLKFWNYDLSFKNQKGLVEMNDTSVELGNFEGSFEYVPPDSLKFQGEGRLEIGEESFTR